MIRGPDYCKQNCYCYYYYYLYDKQIVNNEVIILKTEATSQEKQQTALQDDFKVQEDSNTDRIDTIDTLCMILHNTWTSLLCLQS